MLNAGDLDRRIRLLRPVTFDGALADEVSWVAYAEVWAGFTPVSDGERVRAEGVGRSLTARFVIRWSPEVADASGEHRLEFEGETYGIVGVKPLGRREGLEISAGSLSEQAATS